MTKRTPTDLIPTKLIDVAPIGPLTTKAVVEAVQVNNPAAYLLARLLRIRRPQVQERAEYTSQAEALTILIRVSCLTRAEMAFRLGISVSMLDKAASGTIGGSFHADNLDKAEQMAKICNLPVMAKFFHTLRTYSLKNVRRGPVRDPATDWWKDRKYEEKDRDD